MSNKTGLGTFLIEMVGLLSGLLAFSIMIGSFYFIRAESMQSAENLDKRGG